MCSQDGGKTWHEGDLALGDGAFVFPDGEAVMFNGWAGRGGDRDGVYVFPFRRWTNHGARQVDEEITMILPQKVLMDQPDREPGAVEVFPNHSIIQLRDGSLMASVQGLFQYGPTARQGGWRVFVVRSTDRGRTWHYLSTVAVDYESRFTEGFCEPVLLTMPNGDILSIMRTGGECENPADPMHLSVSKDDGMSWGLSRGITEFGVYPNAVLMENGVIALVYGRPDNWLIFSADYGKTWINNMRLNNAPESVDAGHYNSLLEVEPGNLLVGYAGPDPTVESRAPIHHTHSEIRGTFVYVTRRDT